MAANQDTIPTEPDKGSEIFYCEDETLGKRLESLQLKIELYYSEIIKKLGDSPDIIKESMDDLYYAECELANVRDRLQASRYESKYDQPGENAIYKFNVKDHVDLLKSIALSQWYITKVGVQLERTRAKAISYGVVAFIVILIAIATLFANYFGIINGTMSAEELNTILYIGIPLPVWIWAFLGSLTAMLLRAGQTFFTDYYEGARWITYRSITGVVMGVIIYLLLITGLIVFTGGTTTQVPELIWILAFAGGFSDNLSSGLLKGVSNRLQPSGSQESQNKQEPQTPSGESSCQQN